MPVRAIRGAITLDADTREQMYERMAVLVNELLGRNGLAVDDVISVFVTATTDLRSTFPAEAIRKAGLDVPLLGGQELDIDGALARCVRVLLHVETQRSRAEIRHVYLEGAAALRADLADQ